MLLSVICKNFLWFLPGDLMNEINCLIDLLTGVLTRLALPSLNGALKRGFYAR